MTSECRNHIKCGHFHDLAKVIPSSKTTIKVLRNKIGTLSSNKVSPSFNFTNQSAATHQTKLLNLEAKDAISQNKAINKAKLITKQNNDASTRQSKGRSGVRARARFPKTQPPHRAVCLQQEGRHERQAQVANRRLQHTAGARGKRA